jgi:5-hydroxyisourate hydrolase-like protein (transthyretin family)
MAAPLRLTKGTIEYYPINITSALDRITDLTGTDLRFDIYATDDDETEVSTNNAGENDGMTALLLIDTTDLDEGDYNLYLSFDATPEVPRLGPFRFHVDD